MVTILENQSHYFLNSLIRTGIKLIPFVSVINNWNGC